MSRPMRQETAGVCLRLWKRELALLDRGSFLLFAFYQLPCVIQGWCMSSFLIEGEGCLWKGRL
jgi:hypothetical protein